MRISDWSSDVCSSDLCTARSPKCLLCPISEDCAARLDGTIAQYPGAKPKRARPHRSAQLLLIHDHEGRLLLERRPSTGLWGALWCPPLLGDRKSTRLNSSH